MQKDLSESAELYDILITIARNQAYLAGMLSITMEYSNFIDKQEITYKRLDNICDESCEIVDRIVKRLRRA